MTSMDPQAIRRSPDSPAWITFTYVSFIAALGMVGTGIVLAPIDIGMKGYFAMGTYAGAVLHHSHEDNSRRAGERQAREPHRGRQDRASADGD